MLTPKSSQPVHTKTEGVPAEAQRGRPLPRVPQQGSGTASSPECQPKARQRLLQARNRPRRLASPGPLTRRRKRLGWPVPAAQWGRGSRPITSWPCSRAGTSEAERAGGGAGGCAAPATNMPFDFRRFDIYRKVPKDLTQPTYTGAIISVCCCLFILFLFLSELTGFIATEIVNELYVDDPDKESGGKIEVNLNISLPNLHCELVGLDIQDEMGRHEVGHIDNSMKVPLNNGDGCRFEGHFSINKVPGNFHVSTHSATAQPQNPDMTHIIHKLSFGDKLQVQNIHGAFNALGGADKLSSNPLASHDYILKIVPTVYEDISGKQRYSYQYTVANKICAIIGGTFTVAGILDSCIFTASEAWKKIQLGKMQ
ncbi:endoplasmic reticulum-Golgi intermediate compartment protein 1 isoform X2 [Caretta caretta]|uniref:endoplasmic reticulum-Golgi intermediate compartment protein 1 isoform X2 n=1 Tax=Caretta caretta TaxID=8467 RepID=UPI003F4B2ABD